MSNTEKSIIGVHFDPKTGLGHRIELLIERKGGGEYTVPSYEVIGAYRIPATVTAISREVLGWGLTPPLSEIRVESGATIICETKDLP